MMSTILTLMITAMIFQGVMAVIDSVLDMVGVNSIIKGIPVIGGHMMLVWAYLFVMISDGAIHVEYGANMEVLQMGDFGVDIAVAISMLAFISVKDAAIKALGQGFAR
ncbi:MAG: hypothetical protein MB54_03480 [marine actinobacterium MedAcidi-G2B]|nr:MAG: hypothetical protein MB54_03480 [marine actinobacterium MedAcidi-G2B]MDC0245306.1 hypothetical protein [Acidimicrobiaceae bacterium]